MKVIILKFHPWFSFLYAFPPSFIYYWWYILEEWGKDDAEICKIQTSGRRGSWKSITKWARKQLLSGANVFIFLVELLTLKCSTCSSSRYLLIINPHFKADRFSRAFVEVSSGKWVFGSAGIYLIGGGFILVGLGFAWMHCTVWMPLKCCRYWPFKERK